MERCISFHNGVCLSSNLALPCLPASIRVSKRNGEFSEISTNLFGGNIDVLELDPTNSDVIYVAINASLRKSVDHGVTFTNMGNFPNNITSIEVNNNDSRRCEGLEEISKHYN